MNTYQAAISTLKKGGVGLLPSDTVYGLSCSALNKKAVKRIHKLKRRDSGKPLIILLSDVEQGKQLGLNPKDIEVAAKFWPAPLTVEWPAGPNTPKYLHRGQKHFGVRIPANEDLRNLIKETGPIVSTSANLQGKEPAKTVAEAKKYFGDKLDFYIDAGELKAEPSTIVQIIKGKLKVIRQGSFKVK